MAENCPVEGAPPAPAGCAAFEEGANTKYPDDLAEPGTLGAGEPCRKRPRSGNDERLLDARSLNFSQPAADDVDLDDVEQSRVDRALKALVEVHKLDPNILVSDEWEDLLEAINKGPLPCLETVFEAEPAVLLARASVHQVQARLPLV